MGAKALSNAHPKKFYGSKGARRCRVCGKYTGSSLIKSFLCSHTERDERVNCIDVNAECWLQSFHSCSFILTCCIYFTLFVSISQSACYHQKIWPEHVPSVLPWESRRYWLRQGKCLLYVSMHLFYFFNCYFFFFSQFTVQLDSPIPHDDNLGTKRCDWLFVRSVFCI